MTTPAIPIGGAPPKAHITKDNDGNAIYVHGDISFPIDTEDIGKALQQADDVGQGPARRLMELNGLPVEPWVWRLARPVMLSYVQLNWYRHRGSKPEEEVRLVQKLKDREERYKQEVAKAAAKPPKPAKGLADAVRGGGGTRTTPQHVAGQPYRLRADRQEIWGKFTIGQKALLVNAMVAHKEPISSSALAKLLNEQGFKATQPTERVTSFYYGEWKRNGLIELVAAPAEAGAPLVDEPKPAPAKKKEAPAKKK